MRGNAANSHDCWVDKPLLAKAGGARVEKAKDGQAQRTHAGCIVFLLLFFPFFSLFGVVATQFDVLWDHQGYELIPCRHVVIFVPLPYGVQ